MSSGESGIHANLFRNSDVSVAAVKKDKNVLVFQGMWIRQGAAGFVVSVAKSLNVADVHCNLVPLVQPFLKQPVVQMDSEVSPSL